MLPFMTFIRRHPFVSILLAVLVTVLVTVILLNLSSGEKKIQHRIEPMYGIGDEQFERSMGSLLGPPLVGGNVVIPLRNGDQIFPAMLAAIRSAQHTITFETYIYWSGQVGEEFATALAERARAGVKVHLLVDWVGSDKMDSTLLNQMTSAGVVLKRYHPIRWYPLSRLNNRTHRKILVVDGRIGFTGGVGVADHWLGNAQDKDHWRDSQFQLTGQAVAQMQAAFLDNWMKTTGEVLHGPEYFPALDSLGGVVAQMFRSSPGEGSESVRLMYLLSIASARQSILLSASYFIPDDLSVATLVAARKRGVKIQIIVPGPLIDAEITRKASRARWGPLLESGIEIYEYMPTMFHCKIMVVDTLWTSVGSTNFDNRSFRLNDEANLNVLDRDFALTQVSDFDADLKRSRRITLEMWRNRPWHQKVMEHATALLRSQL